MNGRSNGRHAQIMATLVSTMVQQRVTAPSSVIRLALISNSASYRACAFRTYENIQVISSPRPPVLKVEIRMIVTMTTLEKHISRANNEQIRINLQATKREDQAKAEFLTCRDLEQVLDQRHRQDQNDYVGDGVEKRL